MRLEYDKVWTNNQNNTRTFKSSRLCMSSTLVKQNLMDYEMHENKIIQGKTNKELWTSFTDHFTLQHHTIVQYTFQ